MFDGFHMFNASSTTSEGKEASPKVLQRPHLSANRSEGVFDLSALMVGRTPPTLSDTGWCALRDERTPQDREAAFFVSDSIIYFGVWDEAQRCFLVARSRRMKGSAWIPLS